MVRRLTKSEKMAGYNPRLDEERFAAMTESKVVTDPVSLSDYQYLWEQFKGALDERDKARADYRALEERYRFQHQLHEGLSAENARLADELAALRGKVGDATSLISDAKTKIARALGEPGKPSPPWRHDCNSAAWDMARSLDALK